MPFLIYLYIVYQKIRKGKADITFQTLIIEHDNWTAIDIFDYDGAVEDESVLYATREELEAVMKGEK